MLEIDSLYIYPIKSCRGIRVPSAEIVPGGLRGDRRFMLATPDGQFVSLRTEPRLTRVSLSQDASGFVAKAPGYGAFALPANPQGESFQARIFRDEVTAIECADGSAWFSDYLGTKVRLLYLPESHLRQVNPERSQPGDQVSFADAYPILALGKASLEDLERRVRETDPQFQAEAARFRPNILLRGGTPYEEDQLATLEIAGVPFAAPKLCDRCVVTTLDPKTGASGKEPLKTLATYRRWDNAVWFGTNWIPRGQGTLREGQTVEPLTIRDARSP